MSPEPAEEPDTSLWVNREECLDPWYVAHAGVLGYLSLPLIFWLFHVVLTWLGVSDIEHLAYPRVNDDGDEVTTGLSVSGWHMLVLAPMCAYRLYALLSTRFSKYHFDRRGALIWNTVAVGLIVNCVFLYALDAAIPEDMTGRGLVILAIPALIATVCWKVGRALDQVPRRK